MEDLMQQQGLGRANAACAAIFALFEKIPENLQMLESLEKNAEEARASLLHTRTPDIALDEFDKAIAEMKVRLSKNR